MLPLGPSTKGSFVAGVKSRLPRRLTEVLPPSRPLPLVFSHAWTSHSWPRHPPLGGGRILSPFLLLAIVKSHWSFHKITKRIKLFDANALPGNPCLRRKHGAAKEGDTVVDWRGVAPAFPCLGHGKEFEVRFLSVDTPPTNSTSKTLRPSFLRPLRVSRREPDPSRSSPFPSRSLPFLPAPLSRLIPGGGWGMIPRLRAAPSAAR